MALSRGIIRLEMAVARRALPAMTTAMRRPISTQGEIHDCPRTARTAQISISHADLDAMASHARPMPQAVTDPFKVHFGQEKSLLASMIDKLPMNRPIMTHPLLFNWLNHHENQCPFFYATDKDGKLAGFALCHKTETINVTPVVPQALDLVYVMPKYRTEGVASLLLQEAVKHYRITCFCPDSETAELLESSGFHRHHVQVDQHPDAVLMSFP